MREERAAVITEVRTLGTGAVVALIGRLGGRGLVILGQIIFARFLGAAAFGLFSIGWTMLSMVSQIAPLGLDRGVLRFGALFSKESPEQRDSIIRGSVIITLLTGLLVVAFVYGFAHQLAYSVFRKPALVAVFRGLAPALGLAAIVRVLAAASRITQRMKFGAIIEDIIPPASHLLLFMFFLAVTDTLQAVINSTVWSMIIATLVGLYILRKIFPQITHRAHLGSSGIGDMLVFSIPTALSGIVSMLIVWTNRLIVGAFLPEDQVGIYQAVSQISLLTPILVSGLNTILVPMIADLHVKDELDRLNQLYKISTKWGLYLTVPVFLVVFFFPKDVLVVLFGPQFATGSMALLPLLLAQLIAIATGATGHILIMTGRQNLQLWISVLALLLSIPVSVMAVPFVGIAGAAIATMVGQLSLSLLGLFFVRYSVGLWAYDRRYLKGVIASVIGILGMLVISKLIPDPGPGRLLLSAFISLLLTASVVFVLGFDSEDRALFQLLKERVVNTS